MIPFGDYIPDANPFMSGGATKANNVIPNSDGYRALPNFASRSDALTNEARGLFTSFAIDENGKTDTTLFSGDKAKLYKYGSAQTWSNVSIAAGYDGLDTENDRTYWSFTQFGTNIFATNYVNPIQQFDLDNSSLFANITTTTGTAPQAKYMATVKDFLMTGFTKEFQTAKTFDSSAISSNAITITAHGWLTGYTVVYDNNGNTSLTNLTDGSVYYVIKIDADTIKLATSRANAIAGTVITLSATGGSETHKLQQYTVNKQRVRWSGLNDTATWEDGGQSSQSDYQDLVSAVGPITGLIGGEYLTIITERSIIRGTYVGTPLVFQFDKAADNLGSFAPRSITAWGRLVFFLSDDGFYMFDGINVKPIGANKVNKYFFNDLIGAKLDGICAAIDPKNTTVMWSYAGEGFDGSTNNKLMIYNYSLDRWSTGEIDFEFMNTSAQEAFSLDALDEISTDLDSLPYSLDSWAWLDGDIGIGGFNGSHKFGKLAGTNATATIDTTEFEGAKGRRSTLTSATPIIDGGTTTVTPITRASQADTQTVGTAVSMTDTGTTPIRSTSRFHRLRCTSTGSFTTLKGVDVSARPEGLR